MRTYFDCLSYALKYVKASVTTISVHVWVFVVKFSSNFLIMFGGDYLIAVLIIFLLVYCCAWEHVSINVIVCLFLVRTFVYHACHFPGCSLSCEMWFARTIILGSSASFLWLTCIGWNNIDCWLLIPHIIVEWLLSIC